MPRKTEPPSPDAPRTDLKPERKPYYEGYSGTEEEEGVVREEEEREGEAPERSAGEDSAGGDREIQ